MIPRQNLTLPVGGGIFLRLAGTQLLKPKKIRFFLYAAITFPFCPSPPSCKRKTLTTKWDPIYLFACIYKKRDAGRSLLPETLDALGPKPCWKPLEPFIHSSVGIFQNAAQSCTPAVRGLVDFTSGMAEHRKWSDSLQTDWRAVLPIQRYTSSTRTNTS